MTENSGRPPEHRLDQLILGEGGALTAPVMSGGLTGIEDKPLRRHCCCDRLGMHGLGRSKLGHRFRRRAPHGLAQNCRLFHPLHPVRLFADVRANLLQFEPNGGYCVTAGPEVLARDVVRHQVAFDDLALVLSASEWKMFPVADVFGRRWPSFVVWYKQGMILQSHSEWDRL
jgi:hypothetical protein